MELAKNTVVISRMGHDTGRVYVVTAVLGSDFVLVADGKYRTLDKPKMKRVKHVKVIGETDVLDTKLLTDAALRSALKKFGL